MSLPLALTMGEPAGIGGEIALQAWLRRADGVPPFYLIDDPDRLSALAARLGWSVELRLIDGPEHAVAIFPEALPVMPVDGTVRAMPGRPDPADGALVIGAIDRAVAAAREGLAAAVVTNPINKEALYRAGFRHPGHTEYLAELAGPGTHAVMMLACPELRVVPVTIHLALRQAIETLSSPLIVAAGRVTHAALLRDFAVAAPVIAVAGLNPHAGEGGSLGHEDRDIVMPAIAELRALGIDARGPMAADTMFHATARQGYVSRPGADPVEDDRFRRRGQRDPGAALHPHLARSRHRLRHRRAGCRAARQPDRGLEARRRGGGAAPWRRSVGESRAGQDLRRRAD
jgi:4-hydroxythreonine-4-phosphate dehydrogenase